MRRVVITGLGCISSLGNDLNTTWEGLKAGRCAIREISSIPTENLPVKMAGEVIDFHPENYGIEKSLIRHSDRYSLFALAAAKQAMDQSGLEVENHVASNRIGVAIGSGIGGIHTICKEHASMLQNGIRRVSPFFVPMMIANMAGSNVATTYHAEGPNIPVVTACATGTHSVGEAFRLIRDGRADAMITGGSEAAICELAIAGFSNSKALSTSSDPNAASIPFDARRHGFVMSEGAGVLILEEYEMARKRGAHIYAEVCGYGNTCDAYHFTAPRPDARCATEAIRLALNEASFKSNEKLYINAHGTSTPLNDKTETMAIKQALGESDARKAVISSTKSMIGHALGAAGALELIFCALTINEGIVTPTINLIQPDPECDLDYTPNNSRDFKADIAISNSFGFGGQNACVAIRKI